MEGTVLTHSKGSEVWGWFFAGCRSQGVEVRSIDGMLPLILYVGGEYLAGEFNLDQPLTFLSFEALG